MVGGGYNAALDGLLPAVAFGFVTGQLLLLKRELL